MLRLLVITGLVSLAVCPRAQTVGAPAPEAELTPALAPLAGLLGRWDGPATAMTQSGPVELWQTEEVRAEIGGALIVVEGTGRQMGEDGTPGEVVFNAFGVFSVDAQTGTVWMDAFTQEGRHTRVAPDVLQDGFDWGIDVEAGPTMRYQMRFDDEGRWTETGRVSMDGGETWFDSFSMTLSRVE